MAEPSYPPGARWPTPSVTPSSETRRDAEAALAARQELGADYDDHVAQGLAERMEQLAAYRAGELRHEAERERSGSSLQHSAQTQRFVTALVSLGAGIPITGIAATHGGLVETAVCWAGIVGVNVAQALAGRSRR